MIDDCYDSTCYSLVNQCWCALIVMVAECQHRNQSNIFLSESIVNQERLEIIDDFDTTGIKVMDIMHNPENHQYYRQNNAKFADVITKILNDNNFEIAIKTVKTTNDNTTLRMKHVNSDFSVNYTDAVGSSSKPVVLARGLWSNLLTWLDFGQELAFDQENARDVWLIEITGGPTIDGDCQPNGKYACPNYGYEDLTDYYWPALITGVQNYSGQKTLDYVGFSNGCRVGLDALKNWSASGKSNAGYVFDSTTGSYILSDLSTQPVDRFIGVGCPGAFEGESAFSENFGQHGQDVLDFFARNGAEHVTGRDIGLRLQEECGFFDIKCQIAATSLQEVGENRISRNLGSDYLNFITSAADQQPGLNLQIPRLLIIYGEHPSGLEQLSDGVVTAEDAFAILAAVNGTSEGILRVNGVDHSQLPDNGNTKFLIRRNLND